LTEWFYIRSEFEEFVLEETGVDKPLVINRESDRNGQLWKWRGDSSKGQLISKNNIAIDAAGFYNDWRCIKIVGFPPHPLHKGDNQLWKFTIEGYNTNGFIESLNNGMKHYGLTIEKLPPIAGTKVIAKSVKYSKQEYFWSLSFPDKAPRSTAPDKVKTTTASTTTTTTTTTKLTEKKTTTKQGTTTIKCLSNPSANKCKDTATTTAATTATTKAARTTNETSTTVDVVVTIGNEYKKGEREEDENDYTEIVIIIALVSVSLIAIAVSIKFAFVLRASTASSKGGGGAAAAAADGAAGQRQKRSRNRRRKWLQKWQQKRGKHESR